MALVATATQDCFVGAVSIAPFCSLEGIIKDNINARLSLEEHFGPLQEKHFKAADALTIIQGLEKPILIVHGTEDQSVPFEHGRLLHERIGGVARIVPVQGANHHMTNVNPLPITDGIINWLDTHGSVAKAGRVRNVLD